jgi:hypothetical protein
MPEVQDRRLIRDRIASEFQIAERAHRLDIVERFLGARIRQIVRRVRALCLCKGEIELARQLRCLRLWS